MHIALRLARYALILLLGGILAGALAIGAAYWLISPRLPAVDSLKHETMQVPLRVYSADGKLMATFGETRRIPVQIENVPKRLKDAFLAAEDDNFYQHPGIDVMGTLRAAWHVAITGGEKSQGGSTITQQVARNFFLSPEKSYTRKITEWFVAVRIEHTLSKDQILQLYLNKIFLGHRSYGVAAAAEFYYGKTLDQLTVAECAMLASLPKAPSTGNPLYNREHAVKRRNWVLGQMRDDGFIDTAQYQQAIAERDLAFAHEPPIEVEAPYLAEMVRLQAIDRLGNDALNGGYVVKTTLNAHLQDIANRAVRKELIAYDHRHGYRGPEAHVQLQAAAGTREFDHALADYTELSGMVPGLVTDADAKMALVYLKDGQNVPLDLAAMDWARLYKTDNSRGGKPDKVTDVLKTGDIVRLARDDEGQWQLAQIPAAQAALVSLNPHDGSVRALVGGFNFLRSKFNRATMSARQPGSSFKPFLYSAAFAHGFTPASIINDAPLVFPDPSSPNGLWTPSNDDGRFSGPMRLREALVHSKNLVSVRLLNAIGVRYAREYATRFGFSPDALPQSLSLALGTASVSPMEMARGYSVFANGGYLVNPYFIREIDGRDGKPVYLAHPPHACRDCPPDAPGLDTGVAAATSTPAATADGTSLSPLTNAHAALPSPADGPRDRVAPRVIDVRNAFLITSLMKDVILRGTGHAARALDRPDLAGKTGTTNDHRDAWFSGFNADLVATVWVGFDNFNSLGRGEFGSKAALPIWMDYMGAALKGSEPDSLAQPEGIVSATINRRTGLLTSRDDPDGMQEFFKESDMDRLQARAQDPNNPDKKAQHAYDIF